MSVLPACLLLRLLTFIAYYILYPFHIAFLAISERRQVVGHGLLSSEERPEALKPSPLTSSSSSSSTVDGPFSTPPPLPPKPANLSKICAHCALSTEFERLPFDNENEESEQQRMQRSHSEEVYATPRLRKLRESTQSESAARASLCYAVTDIVRPSRFPGVRRNSDLITFVENPYSSAADRPRATSDEDSAPESPVSLEPRHDKLRRSAAFKRRNRLTRTEAVPEERSGSCGRGEESISVREARKARLEGRVQRAKLVRRTTLDLYNMQITDFCARRTLFQSALIVRLIKRDEANEDESPAPSTSEFVPRVAFSFPEERNGTNCNALVRFFYPDYTRAKKYMVDSHWPGNEEFVVGLTNEAAERKYAYCLRYLPNHKSEDKYVTPEVFVIISPINSASFYLDLARHCVNNLSRGGQRRLQEFLAAVHNKEYPKRDGTLNIREKSPLSPLVTIRNRGAPIGRIGIAGLLQKLGAEATLCCVAALLAEERVLVTGSCVSDVTRTVHAICALIRPFNWQHTFVPVVPDDVPSLCYCPTPYLMGILRSNLSPIRDMLVSNNDEERFFVLVDIELGIVAPQLTHLERASEVQSWMQTSAIEYAESVGMPRRYALSLLKGLRAAFSAGTGAEADEKVENAMIHWYASLFGHFQATVGSVPWDAEAKRRLLEAQQCVAARDYLRILVNGSLFTAWVQARKDAAASSSSDFDGEGIARLNRAIDEHNSNKTFSLIFSKLLKSRKK